MSSGKAASDSITEQTDELQASMVLSLTTPYGPTPWAAGRMDAFFFFCTTPISFSRIKYLEIRAVIFSVQQIPDVYA